MMNAYTVSMSLHHFEGSWKHEKIMGRDAVLLSFIYDLYYYNVTLTDMMVTNQQPLSTQSLSTIHIAVDGSCITER